MLDDLLYKAMTSPERNHYIGVLTTTKNSNRLDLVDGQQRFTVMILMGIVMMRYFKDWKIFLLPNDEKMRLDFSARPDDHEYLEDLIKVACEPEYNVDTLLEENSGLDYENDTMKRGLIFIRDYMNDINSHCSRVLEGIESTANKNDNESLQKSFAQYVFGHLSFFIQKLPDDYTPRMLNKHFESMNSTGRNLENHEILKVQLLKEVDEQEYKQMVSIWNRASRMNEMMFPVSVYEEDKRKEYINKIRSVVKNEPGLYNNDKSDEKNDELKESDNSILRILESNKRPEFSSGNSDNSVVYRPFITFTDFLLNVLYILIDGENLKVNKLHFFNPDKLPNTCAKYIGKNKIKETEFIKAVYCYRIIFDYYVIRIDGNGSYRLASAGDESHKKLEQYQAMLYSGTSRNTYYQWIPEILKFVKNHIEEENLNDKLLIKLKKKDSEIDEHVYKKFCDNTSFKKFSNYFFRRLDYYLWELFVDKTWRNKINLIFPAEFTDPTDINNLERAVLNYRFSQNYNSVEHFEPRNEDEQIAKWEDTDKINSFGNLALVSGVFNSTQNHNSLKLKFARVDDQILKENKLESIKLALMFYSAQKDASKWTIERMEMHEKLMIEILRKSYDK